MAAKPTRNSTPFCGLLMHRAHAVQPFGSPDACRAMDRWLGSRIYLSRQLAPTRWGLGA